MPRVSPRTLIARRARKDERGAIMILGALGLIVALAASALAVDLGRQASEKKSDQLVADLAALDAVRELEPVLLSVPGATIALVTGNAGDAAEASALRNGFDPASSGNTLTTEVGSVDDNNVFTPNTPTVNAVRVTVGSTMDYLFAPGGKSLTAKAVARLASNMDTTQTGCQAGQCPPPTCVAPCSPSALGGFDLGSALASADFDAVSAPVINRVFGQMIGGNADVLSWKGLGEANVSLTALQQELALLGSQVGTPDELLAADLTLNRLFTATANALDRQGTSEATAAANLFRGSAGIIAQSTNTTAFKLADIMEFEQGNGDAVAATNMKVRNLVVAGATAANGSNVISVADAGVTIPNLSKTALELQIVEPPKQVRGPVGTVGRTKQVKLTVTPTIDDSDLSIPLIPEPKITGSFPFTLESAGATGRIADLACVAPGMTVGVDTEPVTGAGSASLRVSMKLPLAPRVDLVDVPTVATMPTIAGQHTDLSFDYDSEFFPTWSGSKRAGTTPINLDGVNYTVDGTPTIITPLPLGAQLVNVTNAVLTRVDNHLQLVENRIITPLVRSLGLTLGVADVTATELMCQAGNPPTVVPPPPGTYTSPPTATLSHRPVLVG